MRIGQGVSALRFSRPLDASDRPSRLHITRGNYAKKQLGPDTTSLLSVTVAEPFKPSEYCASAHGFVQKTERAIRHRLDTHCFGSKRTRKYDRQCDVHFDEAPLHLNSVHAGHPDVRNYASDVPETPGIEEFLRG
jgi:hypothetical protein